MSRSLIAVAAALGIAVISPVPAGADAPHQSPEQRASRLVAQMTLDEKITQTHTTLRGAGGIARFVPGIPGAGAAERDRAAGPGRARRQL